MARPLRADAARNRDKLLVAATEVFGERGLDAPLEHIARRAGVSIGTLYAHFPSRQAFYEAIFPSRLAELDTLAETALADPDPWHGFVTFLTGVFAMQIGDQGLNDAVSQQFRQMDPSCHRGSAHAVRIIERAKESGQLRADFQMSDLASLTFGMSQVIRETAETDPDAWRRCLGFFLDGLRARR
jgi:AcrR family transcriptional regulator